MPYLIEQEFERPLASETKDLVNLVYNTVRAVSPLSGVPAPAVNFLGGYRSEVLDQCRYIRELDLERADRNYIVSAVLAMMGALVRVPGCYADAFELNVFATIGSMVSQVCDYAVKEGHAT